MAEIVALSGQSFPSVWDGMTWPDYRALNAFWKRWPPPAVSMAIMAHVAPQAEQGGAQAREPTEEERAQQMAYIEHLIRKEG